MGLTISLLHTDINLMLKLEKLENIIEEREEKKRSSLVSVKQDCQTLSERVN